MRLGGGREEREESNDVGGDYGAAPSRGLLFHPAVLGVLVVSFFAIGFFAFLLLDSQTGTETVSGADESATGSDDDGSGDSPTDGETDDAGGDDSVAEGADGDTATSDASDGDSSAGPASTTTLVMPAPPDGAYVEASLNLESGPGPGMFKLSGRVPDQALADALHQSAELSYAPFVKSELVVDETLDPAPWLAMSPQVIGLLPSITDGTMRIVDGKVELAARSPNPQYLAQLEGALGQLAGIPVEVVDAQITDLIPPRFIVAVDDEKMTLTGEVPSEEIRTMLLAGAAAAYGQQNVADELEVDEGTYTSFWMYTMPGIFQLFAPFPKYEVRVIDGVSSGSLQGGVSFPIDSAEIRPEAAEVLNIGIAILARDISIGMTVEGHTDSSGPDDYNQLLSEGRAKSVVDYMAAAGIDPARLRSVGAGESEPLVSNDTDEGMAMNRRVEFEFGPVPAP